MSNHPSPFKKILSKIRDIGVIGRIMLIVGMVLSVLFVLLGFQTATFHHQRGNLHVGYRNCDILFGSRIHPSYSRHIHFLCWIQTVRA